MENANNPSAAATDAAVGAYAREKHFSAATLERWRQLPEADRGEWYRLARQLRLGENQFRDILDLVEGVAARRQCGRAEVLALDAVRDVLERGLGRNVAIKAVKAALRRLRYPQLSATEDRLGGLIKALRLPAGVRVEFAENIESSRVSVSMNAQSAGELRAHAAALAAAVERPEVEEIFRVLGGEW